jgi:HTH-type transcriptional regulator/antitoxin HipB
MQTSGSSSSREGARSEQPFRLYSAASIGPAIRRYRGEAGLTQAQLAEMAGLNRTYLSNLEQGKETEQMRRILRVLKLLGVRATLQKADW